MKEFYGFFDSTPGDERVYSSEEFAAMFRALSRDGTADMQDSLNVVPATGMQVEVKPGFCIIDGHVYAMTEDGGGKKLLTLSTAGSAARIDRVVAQLSVETTARKIELAVKEGLPASSPKPQDLTYSDKVKEIALADILVTAGVSSVTAQAITDRRQALGARAAAEHTHAAATAQAAGFLSAADKAALDSLKNTIKVTEAGIDLQGKIIDGAAFR